MKTRTQIIIFIAIVAFLSTVFLHAALAQSKANSMTGYKSFELGYSYTDQETELIYGVSASTVDSKVAQDRANKSDKGKHHEFKSDAVPALFGHIGAKFDSLSIIGKIGGAYVNQTINSIKEPKNVYLAFGVIIEHEVSENIGLRLGYDSVNAVQLGISLKL